MPGSRLCTRLSLDDFLCFNGPSGITVAPDDTKSNFFLHLGLQESSYRHQTIYRRMKEEAKAGMERLFDSRQSLHAHLMEDASVIPPYSLTQMTEMAFQMQVDTIYDLASKQTKGIYDLTRTDHEGNWVIRWMLWRVIQARQAQELQVSNNSAETESSVASSSSIAMDWSTSSVQSKATPLTSTSSPFWTLTALTPRDLSDSDLDEDIKLPIPRDTPSFQLQQTPRRSAFLDVVMTGTAG